MTFGQKHEVLDSRYNDMFTTLFRGFMQYATSAVDYTALATDIFIHISADKKVVLPAAAAANKGKFYIVYFSETATGGGGIVDDKSSPTPIVAQALCLDESAFLLVSSGAAWEVVNIGVMA